ncbi:type IV pilus assembly protein PilM [Patescibacteria group bacterium]|nr:type IV pilus assembly protein PilM [Patescibacteria group bacterium]MBU4512473.1 type IV pilus assembly protein PilM [Patescibacteria group bacterium]MCG2692601.1 type IV pilus assembly protein PilM [Candidatus Parcubacteria bacterium]
MILSSLFHTSPPFGLDISDLSLKLVALEKKLFSRAKNESKSRVAVASYNQIAVPEGFFEQGEIKKPDKIIHLIHKLVDGAKGKKIATKYVISVLPETKTFIKLIEIPSSTPDGERQSAVDEEIKNHIPVPIDEMYVDWQYVDEPMAAKFEIPKKEKIKILVGVAPQKIVEDYSNILIKAGLKPLALEIESAAISRCLTPEAKNLTPDFAQMIIDFGATRTSLLIYDQGTIQFTTSIPFSGEKITQAIAEKLKISHEEAEKSKIVCGLDPKKCRGALKKIIHPNIAQMLSKIEGAIDFYNDQFQQSNEVKKIILCGAGANFKNLDKIIKEKLGVKTEIASPLSQLAKNINGKHFLLIPRKKKGITDNVQIPPQEILSYTTAIGLALRGILIED